MTKQIPLFKVHMPESVSEPLMKTLFSGYIGQGPRVDEFEGILGRYIGNPHVVTLNSATSGLQLALRLAGVGPGTEVITTPMTCTATNMPILAMGADIVWADVDPETGNLSAADVARKITPRTKAILAVHWGGYSCDLVALNALAKKHGIKLIEDAAHAFGAEYKGAKIGTHSDYVVFSFQAIKHISTVDGGALFCRDEADYKRAKLLRWYGIDREEKGRTDFRCESDIAEWGYKFHMNDVCAVIGIEQMKYVDGILAKHRANAKFYDEALRGIAGVRPVKTQPDVRSAYWLYTLHVDRRDAFMPFMKERGVATSKVHNRNDIHTTFRKFAAKSLPGLERFFDTMVCIPVGWWVTEADRKHVVESIRAFAAQPGVAGKAA